ncbi:MAG TPA: DoxX family protein [Streptosporangiaceae bacterium]
MTVLRALARPMLAGIFIVQGYDTFRHPEKVAPRAEPVVRPLAERFPSAVPAKTEDAVRLNGAVQMAAGACLAAGWFPRLAALTLAGTLVPTTAAGHRFWEAEDADRAQQRIHFLKNLSMFGGLLIAAGDTSGQPSLAWRARHGARAASRETRRTAQAAARETRRTAQAARRQAQTARREARLVARTAKVSGKAGRRVGQLTG